MTTETLPATIGRPTEYKPNYVKIVKKLAFMGASQAEIAETLGVDYVSLWRWANRYPAFCKALKIGRDHATDRVERTLYERAIEPEGVADRIFYLKNRRPDAWRERRDTDRPIVAIQINGAATVSMTSSPGVINAGSVEPEPSAMVQLTPPETGE